MDFWSFQSKIKLTLLIPVRISSLQINFWLFKVKALPHTNSEIQHSLPFNSITLFLQFVIYNIGGNMFHILT